MPTQCCIGDEISDTSASVQANLLRILQEGEVKLLGTDQTRRVNVRIIAASNRPLTQLVEAGSFRRDLYYRLRGGSNDSMVGVTGFELATLCSQSRCSTRLSYTPT